MNTKEKYIALFDYIRNTFSTNGFKSNMQFPSEICDHFDVKLELQNLEKNPQPTFVFEITSKESIQKIKLVFISGNILFSPRFLAYRKDIIENNFSGIVTTKKAFFNNTVATFGIVIFNELSEKKYFSTVESSEDLYNIIFDHNQLKHKVFYSDSIDENNLTPENYNEMSNSVKKFISKYETKRLGDIAEVINGAQPSKQEVVVGGVPFIRSVNLINGKIVPDNVYVSLEDCEKFAKQLLQEGDILVTKFFDQKKIVLVKETDLPAIAGSNLVIIRPHSVSDINLYNYLSSDAGKAIFGQQLYSITHGVTVPVLDLSSLRNLEIPMLDVNSLETFNNLLSKNIRKALKK